MKKITLLLLLLNGLLLFWYLPQPSSDQRRLQHELGDQQGLFLLSELAVNVAPMQPADRKALLATESLLEDESRQPSLLPPLPATDTATINTPPTDLSSAAIESRQNEVESLIATSTERSITDSNFRALTLIEPLNEPAGCMLVGGFVEVATMERFVLSLPLSPAQRQQRTLRLPRYWLHLPADSDRKRRQQLLMALQQAGFEDAYRVRDGRYRDAISLGLYDTRAAAADDIGRLRRIPSIPPLLLVPIDLSQPRHWLLLTTRQLAAIALPERYEKQEVLLRPANCDAVQR